MHGWSLGTAYAAYFLVAWALIVGPLNVIRGNANPVHSPMRRDIGIAGGLMAVAHTVVGLQVHAGGQLVRYFLPPPVLNSSDKLFLAANWMGLVSIILLAALVVISNNPSLRSLGLQTWKLLQRGAYPAAVLATLHGLAFQLLEKRSRPLIVLVALVAILVTGLQLQGWRIKRQTA